MKQDLCKTIIMATFQLLMKKLMYIGAVIDIIRNSSNTLLRCIIQIKAIIIARNTLHYNFFKLSISGIFNEE